MKKVIQLLGRVLLAGIFLISGFGKITNFQGTKEYMAHYGMPFPDCFLVGAIFLEIVGAFSILLGYKSKWGAIFLIIFLIPATIIFHANLSDQTQMIMFMKNVSILGGLLLIISSESDSISLDKYIKRVKKN